MTRAEEGKDGSTGVRGSDPVDDPAEVGLSHYMKQVKVEVKVCILGEHVPQGLQRVSVIRRNPRVSRDREGVDPAPLLRVSRRNRLHLAQYLGPVHETTMESARQVHPPSTEKVEHTSCLGALTGSAMGSPCDAREIRPKDLLVEGAGPQLSGMNARTLSSVERRTARASR